MLTLWNPGDDELETLSEGAHVRIDRVLAKAHRGGALQLHSMRNSTYDVLAAFAPGSRSPSMPRRAAEDRAASR